MVANYGLAKSGLRDAVLADIQTFTAVTTPTGVPLKVIFETSQLDIPTIQRLTELCMEAGADFVKTSTGFNGAGATDEGVRAMVETVADRIKFKPSGGIRVRSEFFFDLGEDRLGVNWSS